MPDATERIVNLAMYLAAARGPVTFDQIRAEVEGYPAGQEDAAFARMFERDKDLLREAGFAIDSDVDHNYWLDAGSTFAAQVMLTPQEIAAVRAVGVAVLDDPAFPFAEELRFALAKVATATDLPDVAATARIADEGAEQQGEAVAELDRAISARKSVTFGYTNSLGTSRLHDIEPYGLFVREGRWYLVGRDTAIDETRVYAVARLSNLSIDPARPKSPDFERPEGFDVASFIGLPFQYGSSAFLAVLRFDSSAAWRAPSLTAGAGELVADGDDVLWRVDARDGRRLARWVVENGPGISIVEPASLAEELRSGLDRVVARHG